MNGNWSLFQVTKSPLRFIHLLDSTLGAVSGTGAGEMRLWGGQSVLGRNPHRPKIQLGTNEINVLGMGHETAIWGIYRGVWRSDLVDASLDLSGEHQVLRSFSVQRAGWEFPLLGKAGRVTAGEAAPQSSELVNSKSLRINKYQAFIEKGVFLFLGQMILENQMPSCLEESQTCKPCVLCGWACQVLRQWTWGTTSE